MTPARDGRPLADGATGTENVTIGEPVSIDPNVTLAYPPGRGTSMRLVMGEGATIRSGTVIYAGTTIGRRFETGHNAVVREDNVLGDDVSLWSNSVIDYGCRVGDRVKIHSNVYIPQFTILADDVFVGPGCTFANDRFPGCPESKRVMRGPTLEEGVKVGVNSTILPGVRVGRFSLVGSGSVVTKDVPPGSVIWGNPAVVHIPVTAIRCCEGVLGCHYRAL